ncbi:MAG: HAMP domain-containing protein, partial [Gammaproteobacteria bacterium]|nr:HAMP domain-containing protein [Gammaproteobacteria bacterium]
MTTLQSALPRNWFRLGFSQRILLIALGSFLISTLLIVTLLLRVLNDHSHQLLLEQQQEISEMVARRLDNAINERKQLLEAFAQQLTDGTQLRTQAEIQQLLDQRLELHHFYNGGMVVLNGAGHSFVDSPQVPGRANIDFSDRPHLRSARSSKAAVISRPIIGRGLKSPVFVVDTPILGTNGEALGFIFGVTRLADDNLFQQIGDEALGQNSQHLVIEPNLRLYITASDSSLAMQPLPEPGTNIVVDRALKGEQSGYIREDGGTLTLFSTSKLKIMEWIVVHILPQPAQIRSQRELLIEVGLTSLLFALIIALSSSWLLRRHLRELQQTSKRINAMALEEEPFKRLPVKGEDEIADLNAAFNRLHTQLQCQIKELESSYHET